MTNKYIFDEKLMDELLTCIDKIIQTLKGSAVYEEPKSLEQMVEEAILQIGMDLGWFSRTGDEHMVARSASNKMAQAAIKVCREHKDKL